MKLGAFLHHLEVVALSIGIMSFFATIAFVAAPLAPLKRVLSNFSFTDIYYEISSETSADSCTSIVIVDLTKLTDRREIARTIDDIQKCSPKVIGLDFCLDNEGENIEGNMMMEKVAMDYPNMVWSMKCLNYANDSVGWQDAIHSYFTEGIEVTEGSTNMPRGSLYDSTKRKVPLTETLNGEIVPSFSTQIASMFLDRDIRNGRTGDLDINFSPTYFRKIKPQDIQKNRDYIEGSIVLIGSLYEESDRHWTPVGKIAGVEIIAYAVLTLLENKEVTEVSSVLLMFASLILIFIVQLLQSWHLGVTRRSNNPFVRFIIGSSYVIDILTFLFTSVFLGLGYLLFMIYGISFNIAWAISAIAFLSTSRAMTTAINQYVQATLERYPKFRMCKIFTT
jgi:CHASE2 domain-containing sensor protein